MINSSHKPKNFVPSTEVIKELSKYMLVDGFDFVLDMDKSSDPFFIDKREGRKFYDFFTCFASMPLGMNHPKMLDDEFVKYLGKSAINKPSNSDIYTEEMASFVKTFFKVAVPKNFIYSFFICGGALAVENALKAAFDWKVRKNMLKNKSADKGHQIMHFQQAFHGRTGYTMSLTNTDPNKVMYYPKFNWPRILNPMLHFPLTDASLEDVVKRENIAISQMKQAFHDNPDDIAGIIIEPIQGEGGDNHFRPEFMKQLRTLADENEALLIFDEVQSGVGITGKMWAHEHYGVQPDIMSFGKKMQVCGIIANSRLDEVPDNVFHTSSRINSTWGGNLVDMVRSERYLEIIEEENLVENAAKMGNILQSKLHNLAEEYPSLISNVRGRGLFCAFDLPSADLRNKLRDTLFETGLLILACGEKSIRFRPALSITEQHLTDGLNLIKNAISTLR